MPNRALVDLVSKRVFASVGEAASAAGVSGPTVRKAIADKRFVGGFAFWDAYDPDPPSPDRFRETEARGGRGRQVIELESGMMFGSVAAAARFAGVSDGIVSDAIARKRLVKGYAFAYGDSAKSGDFPDLVGYRCTARRGNPRSVIELGSGRVFSNASEAAAFAGTCRTAVRSAISGKRLLNGYAFAYADDPDMPTASDFRRCADNRHPVVELSTGSRFESVAAAAEWAGTGNRTRLLYAIENRILLDGHAFAFEDDPEHPDIGEYREPLR